MVAGNEQDNQKSELGIPSDHGEAYQTDGLTTNHLASVYYRKQRVHSLRISITFACSDAMSSLSFQPGTTCFILVVQSNRGEMVSLETSRPTAMDVKSFELEAMLNKLCRKD